MSIHDTEFSRRLRSSAAPPSPASLRSPANNHPEDITRVQQSIYVAEYSRRTRSAAAPPSPVSLPLRGNVQTKKGGTGDVFGDITVPVRNGSPRGGSPARSTFKASTNNGGFGSGNGKGKGMVKDYGDR
jgi:hypothetical protein